MCRKILKDYFYRFYEFFANNLLVYGKLYFSYHITRMCMEDLL